MIYINGVKASLKDLGRLFQEVKRGSVTVIAIRKTKKGATAIITD